MSGPQKLILTDVETGEARQVLFNPTEVTIEGDPEWTQIAIPAFSYKPVAFSGKNNDVISFKLMIDGLTEEAIATNHMKEMTAFLASLRSPPENPDSIATASPHSVLVIWPGWLSLVGVLSKCKFKATRFAPPEVSPVPVPTLMECDISIIESRVLPLGAETVRQVGFDRG